ncbi:MAG: macro domain-containing protein [Deltaproteobacteria bacterium]|nr:macro domain-containing protein [Deltaproteobacteria bacterium]
MIEKQVNGCVVRLTQGDITDLEVEAFVYDARPNLVLGSGYGGAIAQRGGPSIQEELKTKGPLEVGQATISGAGDLKAKHIVHAVGPKFQEADEERKLRQATLASLQQAEAAGITQLAFPPMGTGLYGVPLDVCSRVMVDAVKEHLAGAPRIKEVVFVAVDAREYQPFEARLKAL